MKLVHQNLIIESPPRFAVLRGVVRISNDEQSGTTNSYPNGVIKAPEVDGGCITEMGQPGCVQVGVPG